MISVNGKINDYVTRRVCAGDDPPDYIINYVRTDSKVPLSVLGKDPVEDVTIEELMGGKWTPPTQPNWGPAWDKTE